MIYHTFHTMHAHHKPTFYGTATIGTKGQLVIPAEAREELCLKSGDKVVVFGIKEHGMVGIAPTSSVESLMRAMTQKLESMQKIIDEAKGK